VIGVVTRALPARSLGIAVVPMLSSYANILQLHGWHYQLVPVIASTYLFYLYVFGQSLAPAGRFTRMHQIAAVGVTALLVPLVAKQTMGSPWLHPKEKQLVAGDIVNPHDAGVWLAMHTRSTDRVLYYGGDPVAPFVAQRLPATPYIVRWLVDLTRQVPEPPDLDISHKPTLEQSAHIYVMQAKLENDACKRVLDNPPPAMIFEGTPGYTTDALTDYQNFCRPLADLMKQQYHPGAQFGDTRIFLRNDRD